MSMCARAQLFSVRAERAEAIFSPRGKSFASTSFKTVKLCAAEIGYKMVKVCGRPETQPPPYGRSGSHNAQRLRAAPPPATSDVHVGLHVQYYSGVVPHTPWVAYPDRLPVPRAYTRPTHTVQLAGSSQASSVESSARDVRSVIPVRTYVRAPSELRPRRAASKHADVT